MLTGSQPAPATRLNDARHWQSQCNGHSKLRSRLGARARYCPSWRAACSHHDPALADDREQILVKLAGHTTRQAGRVARAQQRPQQLRGRRAAGRAAQDGEHRVQQLGVGGCAGGRDARRHAPAARSWLLPVISKGPRAGQHEPPAWQRPACSSLLSQLWCAQPCEKVGGAVKQADSTACGSLALSAARSSGGGKRLNTRGGVIRRANPRLCGPMSTAPSSVWALTGRERPSGQTRLTEHPGCCCCSARLPERRGAWGIGPVAQVV